MSRGAVSARTAAPAMTPEVEPVPFAVLEREARNAVALISALYTSAETGRPVALG